MVFRGCGTWIFSFTLLDEALVRQSITTSMKVPIFRTVIAATCYFVILLGAHGQCATLSPWYDPIIGQPPTDPGCNGFVNVSVCFTSGALGGWHYIRNTETNAVAWQGTMNGCGFGGNGCDGGCLYEGRSLPPGSYQLELNGPDGLACATFPFTIPVVGPDHFLILDEGGRSLPENPCDPPGWLEMTYGLPSPNCLPPVISRLYINDSPTGAWIDGVVNGGTIRFEGLPLAPSYFVTASAGALGDQYAISVDGAACPSLGSVPSTVPSQPCSPGRIQGSVNDVGCPVVVAVVAVNGSVPATVQWDGNNWWAEGGAGQYAVAIGSGSGACVEEHLVEVTENCPSLGGTPSTQSGTTDSPGRISGIVPELGCSVTVTVAPQSGGQALAVTWVSSTSWYADAPVGQYNVLFSSGGCSEAHVVQVDGLQECTASAQLELVVAQTTAGQPNGSVTYSLSNVAGEGYWMSFTDLATQEVSTSGGTTGITISLYAGEYSVALHGTSGCVTPLNVVIVPCMSPIMQYRDQDGDGDGDPTTGVPLCRALDGYILDLDPRDCNDNDPSMLDGVLARMDADMDGYGTGPSQLQCVPFSNGWRPAIQLWTGDDCDDANGAFWGPIGVSCTQCPTGQTDCTIQTDCACSGVPASSSVDFNNDGSIDTLDHDAIRSHFGCIAAQNPDCSIYDLNHDGVVGQADIQQFNGLYNGN